MAAPKPRHPNGLVGRTAVNRARGIAILLALMMLPAISAAASTQRGATRDDSVYCQNSPGMPARPGPGGYPGTGNQNPFGGACTPNRPAAPVPPPAPPTRELTLTSVAWINEHPNPFDAVPLWGGGIAGPAEVLALNPAWVVKVYLGLIGTANDPPPIRIDQASRFRSARQFRAMMHVRVRLVLDPATQRPQRAELVETILDPGWTPPFNRNRFPPTYLAPILRWITGDPALASMSDPTWYAGQLGVVSGIHNRRHANSVLTIPAGEQVLINGVIRFRAGAHTDKVGVMVGSPSHVPWVWNEFALTYAHGQYWVHGSASAFPTTWWYLNGARIHCQARLADSSFPLNGGMFGIGASIDLARLVVAPALVTGAPAQGGAPQSANDAVRGPISGQRHTVGPGASPWRTAIDGPSLIRSAMTCL